MSPRALRDPSLVREDVADGGVAGDLDKGLQRVLEHDPQPGRPPGRLIRISAMLTGEGIRSGEPASAANSLMLRVRSSSARARSPRIQ